MSKNIDLNFTKYWLIQNNYTEYELIKNIELVCSDNDVLTCFDENGNDILSFYAIDRFKKDYGMYLFLKDIDDKDFEKLINQLERLNKALNNEYFKC